jgi:HD superfamily phosphohydrolases
MFGLSHPRAITRIPDPIHGTIPLTIFERDFVDRPDFQRLHYILQQSVSFVAFPSNKNTRFPHSLGTAHTVGRMFSNALSNAGHIDLRAFLVDAANLLEDIIDVLYDSNGGGADTASIDIVALAANLDKAHRASISGRSGFLHTPLMPHEGKLLANDPGARVDTEEKVGRRGVLSVSFVIDTYWQALKLYALAHDVGHLPMSHAFEVALTDFTSVSDGREPPPDWPNASELFDRARTKYEGKLDSARLDGFLSKLLGVSRDDLRKKIRQKELHEVRSYAILSNYLKERQSLTAGYGSFLPIEGVEWIHAVKSVSWLDEYCRLIHHVALCLIYSYIAHKGRTSVERTPSRFLYAIRQLVDGQVDGDRLDYTLRDCRSAGAYFGEFDLERVIRDAILLQRKDESGIPSGVFAFGFGPRAVAGIEQFFESRYQGYRYLVHHRTASRANVAIQLLLQKLYEFAYLYPDSRCASVMNRLDFIRTSHDGYGKVVLSEILPSGTSDGEALDDASLRVLMKRCRAILREEDDSGHPQGKSEEYVRRGRQLSVLIEMLLFRALEHTETLFKVQTVAGYLTQTLGIVDKQVQVAFTKQVAAPDQLARIAREINTALADPAWGKRCGYDEPLLLCAERVVPKCFRAKVPEEHVHEEFTWIADPTGEAFCIDTGHAAPTLCTMEQSRESNLGLRFYLIGRNLKANPHAVLAVEDLVNDHIRRAYEDFKSWTPS